MAIEWLGGLAAVLAVTLTALALLTIYKGRLFQGDVRHIVQDLHTTNDYFASRADFTMTTKARDTVQTLAGVLSDLNKSAAQDVANLAAIMPDVQRLLAAGRGDVNIAQQLQGVGATLQSSATSIRGVANNANSSVAGIDAQLSQALSLVRQLNGQLAITQRKLAILPPLGG
jgi:hypothetical protein